ncbi:T3JAM protein, partial [Alcedo cyanopectus]|nr:T3JAM protein [Ceyx cyanopectus]
MGRQPQRARPRRGRESSEERSERRQETRESLRRRNNLSSCRLLGRAAEEPPQSPRQREFLRRRNLGSEAGRAPRGQEPKGRVPPDLSSAIQLQVRHSESGAVLCPLQTPPPKHPQPAHPLHWDPHPTALSFQHPWSCPMFPPAHSPLSLSDPLSIPATVPRKGASVNTQATELQGLSETSANNRSSWGSLPSLGVPTDQISPFPQEALHRELLLKQKMVILQELFSTLLQASEKSWQGQLNEDKLKCKLRALENQLQACTQSYSKECMKKILIEMEDQKQTYEQKAKEALQKMLEDKLQTEQQLQSSQRSLAATREDLDFWKEHYTTLKAELTQTSTAHSELQSSFHLLQSQLRLADGQKEQLGQALHALQSEHAALRRRISALREDNDLKARHISAIEDKLQEEQHQKVTLEATISHLHKLKQTEKPGAVSHQKPACFLDQVFTTQTPPHTPDKEKQNTLLEHPEKEEEGEESLKEEIQKRTSQLTAKENECTELRSELEALSEEYRSCLTRLRQCRDELNRFQSRQAKRGHWIPLLVAVIAVAVATFLASYRP